MKTDLELFMDGLIIQQHIARFDNYHIRSKFKRKKHSGMTVYKQDRKSDKVIIFLSGGVILKFTHYLRKLVDDLFLKDCDILVFENKNAFNLTGIQTIADYLNNSDYSKITIVGCSVGGIVGSHILSKVDKTRKKLICIDSPFNLYASTLEAYEKNFVIWRPDIYVLYRETIEIVQKGVYNSPDVLKITSMAQYIDYVSRHFGIVDYKHLSTMNPFIKNCEIINFYNEQDPVLIRHIGIPTLKTFIDNLDNSSTFTEFKINCDVPGHCTEWVDDNSKFIRQLKKTI